MTTTNDTNNDMRWLIARLYRLFPGLWDGTTEVNGAELADVITGELSDLDSLSAEKMEVIAAEVENGF